MLVIDKMLKDLQNVLQGKERSYEISYDLIDETIKVCYRDYD